MNLPLVALAAFVLWPRSRRGVALVPGGVLVSGFGVDRGTHRHQGIDLAAPRGTPVHAAHDGVVVGLWRNGALSGAGVTVSLYSTRQRVATLYEHLASWRTGLRVGSRVRRGDVLGAVGDTDSSADDGRFTTDGPHLHIEVMPDVSASQAVHFTGTEPARVDPLPWLRAQGVRV